MTFVGHSLGSVAENEDLTIQFGSEGFLLLP